MFWQGFAQWIWACLKMRHPQNHPKPSNRNGEFCRRIPWTFHFVSSWSRVYIDPVGQHPKQMIRLFSVRYQAALKWPRSRASCNWSTIADALSICMLCTSNMHPYFVNFSGIECAQLPCWPLLSHLSRELFASLSRLTVAGCGVRFQWEDDEKFTNKNTPWRESSLLINHMFWMVLSFGLIWCFKTVAVGGFRGFGWNIWVEPHGNSPRKITNGQTFRSHPPMSACGPGGLLELITMVLQMDAMPVLGGAHRNRQSSFVVVVVVVVVVLPCGKTLRKAGWNMGPPMFNRGKLICSNFKRVHFPASYVSFLGIFVSFHRWCVFPSPTGSGFSQKNPEPTFCCFWQTYIVWGDQGVKKKWERVN